MTAAASEVEGFELLARARGIVADYRFVADPIDELCTSGRSYGERAEAHLLRLYRSLSSDSARFDDAIEAFVEMTFDVMRMQERYFRTGQFDAGSEAETSGSLYEDDDVMGRRYLCGLYLAQVFWPNHLEKLQFFEDQFLPLATPNARVLEVGTGPGTFGLAIGRSVDCAELILNDISPLSIDMAARMAGVDPVRRRETLRFTRSDFLADFLEPDGAAAGPFDLVLFSEIVEHLRDPGLGLDKLGALLAPQAAVFFTTATNAAFYDHAIVFESIEEIRWLLAAHGFEPSRARTILAAPGPDGRDVLDYVAILRRVR